VHEVFGDHDLRKLTSNSETVAVHHHFATWSSQWEEPKIAWSSQSPLKTAEASPTPTEVARLSDIRRDLDRGNQNGDTATGPEHHETPRPLPPLFTAPLRPAEAKPAPTEVLALSASERARDGSNHEGDRTSGPEGHTAPRPVLSLLPAPLRPVEASPMPTEAVAFSDLQLDSDESNPRSEDEGDRTGASEDHTATKPLRRKLIPSLWSRALGFAVLILIVGSGVTKVAAPVGEMANTGPLPSRENEPSPAIVKIADAEEVRVALAEAVPKTVQNSTIRPTEFGMPVHEGGTHQPATLGVSGARIAPPPPHPDNSAAPGVVKIADAEGVRPAPTKPQPSDLQDPTTDPAELSKRVKEGSSDQKTKRAAPLAASAKPIPRPDNMAALGVVKVSDTEAVKPLPAKTHLEQAQNSALDPAELWKRVAQGNISAEISLATLYLDGSATVEQNCEQAHQLLMVASRTGSKVAGDLLNGKYAEQCHGPQP
jgi:hypothetical protein